MTDIVQDWLNRVGVSLKTDPQRREEILRELRGHIEQEVEELARADPARDREAIVRDVLARFGSPEDLAVAYEAEGAVIRSAETGEVLLRVGRAVGKGAVAVGKGVGKGAKVVGRNARRAVKWVAVAAGIFLTLLVILAVIGLVFVKPIVVKNVPYDLYVQSRSCTGAPCTGITEQDSFFVHQGAREVRMELDVWYRDPGNGTVHIQIVDANGKTRFEQTYAGAQGSSVHKDPVWAPVYGDWSVKVDISDFEGTLRLQVFAIGLPTSAF